MDIRMSYLRYNESVEKPLSDNKIDSDIADK